MKVLRMSALTRPINGGFGGSVPSRTSKIFGYHWIDLSTWKIPQCFTFFRKKSVVSARRSAEAGWGGAASEDRR